MQIILSDFMSLDGVVQAPGGRDPAAGHVPTGLVPGEEPGCERPSGLYLRVSTP